MPPFHRIGVISKPSDPGVADTLGVLSHFLERTHYPMVVDPVTATLLPDSPCQVCELDSIGEHCDLLIAIGGDGTFLSAARAIARFEVPLVGVNQGRLGFLTDISQHELIPTLNAIFAGLYREELRYLLKAKIIRDGSVIHEETAVNEVVIHRWITPSMIEIITTIDGVFLNSQRSDGLIISTPTGSTAYALSAGGPILHPSLNALVLVPLNPHTFSNRPIVINDNAEIVISFHQTKQINALVTCDHLEIPDVLISDKILIKKEPKPFKMLHPEGHDFFNTLRKKLNWSGSYS